MSRKVFLAIEAAVGGGSLALAREQTIIAKWEGESSDPRSEELLIRVSKIMADAEISPSDLARIAVSKGPGSYTGIRVGIATALGLATALHIPCLGVLLLNSVARSYGNFGEVAVTVPIGRGNYCWQAFRGRCENFTGGRVTLGTPKDLYDFATANPDIRILAQSDAYLQLARVAEHHSEQMGIIDIGRNLASSIVLERDSPDEGLEPFYARGGSFNAPTGG